MKHVVITVIVTAVLVFGIALAVGEWACERANEVFDAKDAEIVKLADEKIVLKTEVDYWEGRNNERKAETKELRNEIAEWEACAEQRWWASHSESNEPTLPVAEIQPTFTDRVQTSLKGVVHIQCPDWQLSGFVVGPRLIVTARHGVEGVESFTITTYDDHVLHATRAISDKEHDVAFIWVDDLECIATESDHMIPHGGGHEVVLASLSLGSIGDCVLGSRIYLIGSPLGAVHFNALTVGYISKLDTRLEDFGCPEDYGWASITTIDAVALKGNSGCPVFDMTGRVIGVLVGGRSDALNWIVPVDVFVGKIKAIELAFILDQYQREESAVEDIYEYYN